MLFKNKLKTKIETFYRTYTFKRLGGPHYNFNKTFLCLNISIYLYLFYIYP